jgi:hypothetical protein
LKPDDKISSVAYLKEDEETEEVEVERVDV